MIIADIERVFTPGLAQVAYMITDRDAHEVAVIDPRRDTDVYVDWARDHGVKIVAILETHVHADFVSGAPELAARTGAPLYASRIGESQFPHKALDDGDAVPVGALTLRALHTPGHTPEHMAYLLFEPGSDAPRALFSGDALFVGDVGRPDLLGKEATAGLSKQLFETVTMKLKSLPDNLQVYPGHTGGSACGKQIGDAPDTTIGAEKAGNYAFGYPEEDAFVEAVMSGMPKPPTYYPELKKLNKQGATPISALPDPVAMSADTVVSALEHDALVLDVRSPEAFAVGHIPGAYFAGFGPSFQTWLGWLAPYDRDIVIVTDDGSGIDEVLTALRQIGLDRVIGYLENGMAGWPGEREALAQLSPADAASDADLTIVDVRADQEWDVGHPQGAVHIFLGDLMHGARIPDAVGETGRTALFCGSGYRSTVAASILLADGRKDIINIPGGVAAWSARNLPLVRE